MFVACMLPACGCGSSGRLAGDGEADATDGEADPEAPPEETLPVCGAGDPGTDEIVFTRLTATSWYDAASCEAQDPLPPTCNRLRFSADGTYWWRAESDYVERDQSGRWNFRARDGASGIVCLDDGSVVDFLLTEPGLRWTLLGVLSPDRVLEETGTRAGLPSIEPAPLYVALTAHPWRKTNDFDLYREPTSFTLLRNGTLQASYRDGECEHGGVFSLIADELQPRSDPNTCDMRGGGTTAQLAAANEMPWIEEGVLYFYSATYRDAAFVTEERLLALFYYGEGGLLVTATWQGPLRSGSAAEWSFAFRNRSDRLCSVTSLSLAMTPLVLTSDSFSLAGDEVVLVDRNLAGTTIEPQADFATTVSFTPSGAGWTSLEVDIEYFDDMQSYSNVKNFVFVID
jgi:hypothetical protein